MTTCPKCDGMGSFSEGSGFINAGGVIPVSKTCDECNGTGQLPPRFFVDFIFDYDLTGRRYWFPLFIHTDDRNKAKVIIATINKALAEHFKIIEHSAPIPEANFSKSYIQKKYNLHKHQKLAKLNVGVWTFTEIEPNPDWSFDEHLKLIAENKPLIERQIANRVKAHQFPVRVVREGQFPIDFKEFLLINVVKH